VKGLIVRSHSKTPKTIYIKTDRKGEIKAKDIISEEMELLDIVVVKHDGRRETYAREKLKRGILQSLTKRPYTEDGFERLIHQIERDIQKKKKREITSSEVGELVMKHLSKFDTVAYIRFASIYRAFEDVSKFQSEIQTLKKHRKLKDNN
jgi:transcriptional repressor NrdR